MRNRFTEVRQHRQYIEQIVIGINTVYFRIFDHKQTHKYIIDEYEAEAVKLIFRDVADGCGYNAVLNKLNAMGYRTRLGNTFSKETLYEMLRNEKCNGVYVFSRASNKNESGRRNNHKDKPEDE